MLPRPSWPQSFFPHVHTRPSAPSATLWRRPAATMTTAAAAKLPPSMHRRPNWYLWSAGSTPSWPCMHFPHPHTLPAAVSSSVKSSPHATITAGDAPKTPGLMWLGRGRMCTSEGLSAVPKHPVRCNCAFTGLPHSHNVPSSVTHAECCFPHEAMTTGLWKNSGPSLDTALSPTLSRINSAPSPVTKHILCIENAADIPPERGAAAQDRLIYRRGAL